MQAYPEIARRPRDFVGGLRRSAEPRPWAQGDATGKNDTINLTINPPGALRWTRQLGTRSNDLALAIATDATGNVTNTGAT